MYLISKYNKGLRFQLRIVAIYRKYTWVMGKDETITKKIRYTVKPNRKPGSHRLKKMVKSIPKGKCYNRKWYLNESNRK